MIQDRTMVAKFDSAIGPYMRNLDRMGDGTRRFVDHGDSRIGDLLAHLVAQEARLAGNRG